MISDFNADPVAFYSVYKARGIPGDIKSLLYEDNKSDEGVVQCFEIVPNIQTTYNDLNMDSYFRPLCFEKNFLQINHRLEGCYERGLEDGAVSLLGEGDLCVGYLSRDRQVFPGSHIPLKKYRGITMSLEMETAQRTLDSGFQRANTNLKQIKDRLCSDGRSLIIKSRYEIDHIFSELCSADERIQISYFWTEVIELLLFLSLLGDSSVRHPQQFSADISRRTQEVYQYIIENPFMKETIPGLAYVFGVTESSLGRCFESIAGVSIGVFVRSKRVEAAAKMLVSEPTLNIGEVGSTAGYENQSKFSAAFKSALGVTPQAYRYKHI